MEPFCSTDLICAVFALRDLRDAVALVPQKPFLFDATVRENIEMGKSPYSTATVEDAAEASHSSGFIADFPDRFDQRLGENGNRLSGGQLQRLALARAFYKNSPLLVLDRLLPPSIPKMRIRFRKP